MSAPPDPHSQTEIAPADAGDGSAARMSTEENVVRLAGRYDLLGMLGAGAMGTVYRARDVELDELVALKVLKKELAASPGMVERFRREVRLARRVTHRNVARTFDIGDHDGDRFLTMEYVEGEMLGARLARTGRLPWAEAVRLVHDVCLGLEAAHASGVLHRDLKPENVIVARKDGRAVITDFGIARAFAEGEARRTSGMLVGTPAYMAPEQVEAAEDLDARADLYALGAMLFELVTGTLPFQGDSVFAMAAARLLRPAPDPRSRVPDLPAALADVTGRLLARRREDRPASAADAAKELAAVASTATASAGQPVPTVARGFGAQESSEHARSIAVLPLLNAGPEEDAYLAQVLTEDLVDLLSVVAELRVRPRGETAAYQTASRDVRDIGRALGVDVVVDGSVRRIEQQVRVSVRLVTVADGFQLWAKRFDRASGDVLGVADAASAAISRALTTRTVDTVRAAAVDGRAQDLYLRARYLIHRAWHEESREAVTLLREARSRAPEDARIVGTLALALTRTLWANEASGAEVTREARAAAEEALRLSPVQPEGHVARGLLHLSQNEVSAAVSDLGLALERAPNNVDALDALGRVLVELGRVEEGTALLTRVLAIEPDFVAARNSRARAHALQGMWDRAEADLETVPSHPSDLVPYLLVKARLLLLWKGRAEIADEITQQTAGMNLPPFARQAIDGLVGLVRATQQGAKVTPELLAHIDGTLPIGKGVSPRRASFNAQTAAEALLVFGAIDEAVARLEVADANGLFDIGWLERMPLVQPFRGHAGLERIRQSVARRAERALEALDAASPR